ncbi:MAG: CvpA family protein [Chloroflexales bacterium]|nr:CvpA family protein [Chloroflexales bacterium]
MNTLDMIVLIMLALFTALGVYWGLIRQVLSIVGLLVGVAMAGRYGPEVAAWLSSFSTSGQVIDIAGFIAVLVGVSAIASLIASLLRLFVGLLFLGWVDHLLGGILGLIQGLLASAAVLIALVTFSVWQESVADSRLADALLWVGKPLTFLLPEIFRVAG